ncbi:hypothetical protein [Actinomadura sp. 9N215]|uniref:hypothetical protein n=1 Tax=Actinomadura sp. 9N215 TaxID=3375150 RepID=UPI00379DB184
MTHHEHDDDPAALTDPEFDRLLREAYDDLLRHTREHINPMTGLLAFMDDDAHPPQPEPTRNSDGLVVLELRTLTQRTLKRLPEGILELRAALLRADLPNPNLKHLTYLMTLTQALITISDTRLYVARARATAQCLDLATDLDSVRNIARDLGRATDLHFARSLAQDLAQDLYSARAIDRTFVLYHALERNLANAIDPVRGPVHCPREVASVIATDLDGKLGWSSESVFALVRAAASALGAESVNLSGMNVSHLRDIDLEALAGTVWNRATTWPANIRDLIEDHSEEIDDGVFQVRRGTERDPHDSVLA